MPVTTYPASITIEPMTTPIDAVVDVPGSKSITNRALLVAALANGQSELSGALFSDDTLYMAEALRALGIDLEVDQPSARFLVQGGGGTCPASHADLFVGNSGTTMRFLTAALPLGHGEYRIDGVPRMRQRPIAPLLQALNELGADVESETGSECPPVLVRANGLPGGTTEMAGDQSSQYFTGLLLAAPAARGGVTVRVKGDLVSKPYITITAEVMRAFGVDVSIDTVSWREFSVAAGQQYVGRAYRIEPDASNASYFFAAAAVTGGRVRVQHLGETSIQGDLRFVDVLAQMGASVTKTRDWVEVEGPPQGALRGIDVDMNAISDTAQTLAAIAPFAADPVAIRGVEHMRMKETDRVAAVANELRGLGQGVEERPDGLTIFPAPITPASIATYDDHRMAMSFTVTGLRAPGVTILDPGCVSKTFPDFFERVSRLRG